MAQMKLAVERVIDVRRPAPFRKLLVRGLRSGRYSLRIAGGDRAYFLAIQRGRTLWRVSAETYTNPIAARTAGEAKFGVKAVQHRAKKAA